MATLQLPIVPSRLHRYRSFTRSATAIDEEIDSIVKNYIFCSNFSRMNDPMEGFYESSRLLRGLPEYKAIARDITDVKSTIGMACFSERNDSVLMWAHYAANYSGICISYSGSELVKGLADAVKLVRLAYVDEPPTLFPSHAGNAENAATRILSQKKQDWAYEREWRILGTLGVVSLGHVKAIKRISFGLRIDPEHREKVLEAIDGTKIEAEQMKVDKFGIVWEPIKRISPKKSTTSKKRAKTSVKK